MAPPDDDLDKVTPPDAEPSVPPEVSRRDFLKTVGVAGAASGVAAQTVGLTAQTPQVQAQTQAPTSRGGGAVVDRPYMRIRQEVAENLVKRGIVGYASHLRVQPGETIRFMVSSEVPRYRADIVRLIHGDANPKGPGIKEVVVARKREPRQPREVRGLRGRDVVIDQQQRVPFGRERVREIRSDEPRRPGDRDHGVPSVVLPE